MDGDNEQQAQVEVKRRGRPRKIQIVGEGQLCGPEVTLGEPEETYGWVKLRLSQDREVVDFLNELPTECAFAAKVYFKEERYEVFYPVKN